MANGSGIAGHAQNAGTNPISGEEEQLDQVGALSAAASQGGSALSSNSVPPGGASGVGNTPSQSDPTGAGTEPSSSGPDFVQSRATPEENIRNQYRRDPVSITELQEKIAQRVIKASEDPVAKAQAIKMTDTLAAQGANPKKALEQNLAMGEKEIDRKAEDGGITSGMAKKLKARLRKAYDLIPEEEMGLFLVEFGLRAMMAGETMGTLGALGAAGSGALGSMQGRKRQAMEDRVAAEKYGIEQGTKEYEVLQKDRELGIQEKMAETDRQYKLTKGGDRKYAGKGVWLAEMAEMLGRDPDDVFANEMGEMTGQQVADAATTWIRDRQAKLLDIMNSDDPTGALAAAGFGRSPTVTWKNAKGETITKKIVDMEMKDFFEYGNHARTLKEAEDRASKEARETDDLINKYGAVDESGALGRALGSKSKPALA